MEFENCHCHTYYSNPLTLPDSPVSIEDYANAYRNRNMHCLILTEHGMRGDAFKQQMISETFKQTYDYDLKPICGAEVYFVPDRNPELADGRNFHLLLLTKDMTGFRQLNKILSEAQYSGFYKNARVDFDLLSKLDYKHFLCSSACLAGPVKDKENGEKYVCQLAEIFKENFRLEVQYHNNEAQAEHNAKIIRLYKKYKWSLIFATDSHYVNIEDKILRKELQLSSNVDLDDSGWDLYLPTAEQAYKDLVSQGVLSKAQIEEAFENTLEVREFEGFNYDKTRKFPVSLANRNKTPEEKKRLYQQMVCDGYIRQEGMPTKEEAAELRSEMNTILSTDSEDYFIGLSELIEEGKRRGGRPTKTSRGSACGFGSNFGLGLTSINRLHSPVKMYPSRFVTAEKIRVSMPDIDENVADQKPFDEAGKAIFGENSMYPMVAYGTTKTSSAFKLLARARNLDFDVQNEITKQIQRYEKDVKHAKENNADDPDYNVDDDIVISDYVEQQYLNLVEESKQYQNIIMSISVHPCARLIYEKDLREEIGIIRVKSKSGNKQPVYCVYIDGATADYFGFCKLDILKVLSWAEIYDTFALIGQEPMPVNELLEAVKRQPEVWSLYEKGFTMGLSQVEQEKTTQRVMQFKPKNTVELSAFISAIRPGAKSLVDDYVSRRIHTYNIPSLDKLLRMTGATPPFDKSAFLLYDENVLTIAQAAGIEAEDSYLLLKGIKKKKEKVVKSYKEKFVPGFTKHLIEDENVEEELAEKTADDIWNIILNSASYLFELIEPSCRNTRRITW